jgi:predicted amidohydrolase
MPDKIKIAAVQTNPKITKTKENLDKILSETETAAKNGADLIVFPECTLTGYVFSSREEALPFAESIPGASTDRLVACCQELGVYVVVGLLEKDADKCYNAAVLVGPGGLIGKYRKNHLPFIGVDRFLDAGDRPFQVYQTPIGNIGLHICYDSAFPESTRVMALLGADIVVLPTNFPEGREKMLDYVVNTRALENAVYLVAVNRVGSERGSSFCGRSKIIGVSGDTLVEASRDKEEIVYTEVSLAEARQKHIVFKAGEFEIDRRRDRRPELYGEITRPRPR